MQSLLANYYEFVGRVLDTTSTVATAQKSHTPLGSFDVSNTTNALVAIGVIAGLAGLLLVRRGEVYRGRDNGGVTITVQLVCVTLCYKCGVDANACFSASNNICRENDWVPVMFCICHGQRDGPVVCVSVFVVRYGGYTCFDETW